MNATKTILTIATLALVVTTTALATPRKCNTGPCTTKTAAPAVDPRVQKIRQLQGHIEYWQRLANNDDYLFVPTEAGVIAVSKSRFAERMGEKLREQRNASLIDGKKGEFTGAKLIAGIKAAVKFTKAYRARLNGRMLPEWRDDLQNQVRAYRAEQKSLGDRLKGAR